MDRCGYDVDALNNCWIAMTMISDDDDDCVALIFSDMFLYVQLIVG